MLYTIDGISYDYSQGIIVKNGNEIKLTNKQKDLLNYFIDNPKTILTKQKIMEDVWGRIITENSVDQFVSTLRGYLEEVPNNPKLLLTHFGKGISFECVPKFQKSIKSNKSLTKKFIIVAFSIITVGVGYLFLDTLVLKNKPTIINTSKAQINRMLFISDTNEQSENFNQNSASQQLISELLRFSDSTDIVDTSRFVGSSKKQELAKQMRLFNPSLYIVKTQLKRVEDSYVLNASIVNGIHPSEKKQFISSDIHEVIIDAASWLSKNNSKDQANDVELSALLPKDKYLIETYMRGFSFTNKGETAKAIEFFKLCLQEKPDFHLARLSLAKAFRRHSQYQESLVQLETLRSVNLNNNLSIVVDSEFAAVELLQGHLAEAKLLFEKIINDYPLSYQLYPAYMNLAATDYRMGNYDKALERLKLLELTIDEKTHPEDAALVFNTMSGIYMYQNELDKSLVYINKSYDLFKKIGDRQREGLSLARLSNYYYMVGELRKAENYINQSLEVANQLNNKRSQQAALNHMVEFKLIEGEFDEASKLNTALSDVAIEINSIPGQTRAAQWESLIAIEKKQYTKARQYILNHLKLAKESHSKPSINANLFLELKLALAQKEMEQATKLIQELEKMDDKNFLNSSFIPLYLEYLSMKGQKARLFQLIEEQGQKAIENKDKILQQKLDIIKAEEYLKDQPLKSINILTKITVNELIQYPYYSTLARAYFNNGDYLDALVQMENAKQSYKQRWNQELQQLYYEIKQHIKN